MQNQDQVQIKQFLLTDNYLIARYYLIDGIEGNFFSVFTVNFNEWTCTCLNEQYAEIYYDSKIILDQSKSLFTFAYNNTYHEETLIYQIINKKLEQIQCPFVLNLDLKVGCC